MKIRFIDMDTSELVLQKSDTTFSYHEGDFLKYGSTKYKVEKVTMGIVQTSPSGSGATAHSDVQWAEELEVQLSVVV